MRQQSRRRGRLVLGLAALVVAAGLGLLLPAVAMASYSTSQIGIDDDKYTTNSVKLTCPLNQCFNQSGGTNFSQCFATPNTFTHDYNWYYQGSVIINQFGSTNCSGTAFKTYTIFISTTNPNPWFCYNYPQQGGWQC